MTERCGHLFHVRMAAPRTVALRLPVQQVTHLLDHPPVISHSLSGIDRLSDRRVTYPRSRRSMPRTWSLHPLVFVRRTASLRFPRAALSLIQPRALAVSLAPNRACASSLLPPARADHVLFSRSPPSGMRPSAATVRNSCCACVKTQVSSFSSRFSLVSFSPLLRSTPRALAHPLVTLLSLVAHGRRRPCRAPFARSRSRPSCVLQLVLRVRHGKHAPPPAFLQLALSPISARRRLCDFYSVLHLRSPSSFSSFHVLFFPPMKHFSSIFISLFRLHIALSRLRVR